MTEQTWLHLLADFPVRIEIPVAWGEMDAFGHVNNTVYLRYFESARIAYFEKLGTMETMAATGIGPILAETRCRFKLPLTYPDTVTAGARIAEISADRFLMHYRVVSHRHGKVAADGDGRIVSYNYKAGAKAPLPEVIVARIRELEGPGLEKTPASD
jgi:acyl-CoA thioester hydrolase